MTPVSRRRSTLQILLLSAGFFVLVAVSVASVLLVNKAREDNAWVVHTVEVESQVANLLLDVRRAESATRAYLLTSAPQYLSEYQSAAAALPAALGHLQMMTVDNPAQVANAAKLKAAVEQRLAEFALSIERANNNDAATSVDILRQGTSADALEAIARIGRDMRTEEDRLLAERTATADRTQVLASSVTIAGSCMVLALAALSLVLLRQSSRARDEAEARLRDSNVNLETIVDERTADLREANEEIQRFAYIVSHDLRSPLVNIMGFTSELEELRGDIFKRIATLNRTASLAPAMEDATDVAEPELEGSDKQLSDDFNESLGFIKSSIAKMDRLISAILNLTREGRREFKPERIDLRELIDGIVKTVAHQAAEANATVEVGALPNLVSDRLALEQIFSNLIDNALKYLKDGVPGEISIEGRTKLGFAIFEVTDNGRGIDPKDHQRIFDLFRRAGTQDKPGQGIGLAHVRALVRRLGGTMSVTSELHNGSTFTITLPIKWSGKNSGKNRDKES
ncbi:MULTISPECIES: CHASE3 domain-containing protein [unclassified Bradyrhizobium]|uniref:sensor histidine kinase n=1 Tax=unclassified Bradyrhizobium TaxID=2631580 RepID=UPI001BA47241|nr:MULTISPECIES: CHASE3 domain-containing protein [unclassified Bradyrhizobium]MBR1206493.1 CHASE3 domain-containing protein [Bradyrhizobium sp. AUGA SZCCT0124]MBR1315529.1 CHASE3 domain-containing protein [Bradyrhizobium sp. AUGA SZCCT0051]MBR1338409.1 CHASE3 domain-containing protein [Bradyrhizobium sp. AUGA SZCCT0105]MBR1356064.1 CHASE3 domain-containing protein [Bradyrhizobium sp. AUGA SZCCT0045]